MAFRALPRPQFASLQSAVFPIYFSIQSALPVLVALTASREAKPIGISGLLAAENRGTLIPMATAAVSGLINMFILGPMTVNVMKERKHQGKSFRVILLLLFHFSVAFFSLCIWYLFENYADVV